MFQLTKVEIREGKGGREDRMQWTFANSNSTKKMIVTAASCIPLLLAKDGQVKAFFQIEDVKPTYNPGFAVIGGASQLTDENWLRTMQREFKEETGMEHLELVAPENFSFLHNAVEANCLVSCYCYQHNYVLRLNGVSTMHLVCYIESCKHLVFFPFISGAEEKKSLSCLKKMYWSTFQGVRSNDIEGKKDDFTRAGYELVWASVTEDWKLKLLKKLNRFPAQTIDSNLKKQPLCKCLQLLNKYHVKITAEQNVTSSSLEKLWRKHSEPIIV